jgi:GNAT superfamily N-acetyltransferase
MITTLSRSAELAVGTNSVRIRQILPADAPALEEFYAGLSPESRRLRFLSLGTRFGDEAARYFCSDDHEHREGFVAETPASCPGGSRIVGHLCLEPTGDAEMEIAVAVADEFQRHGIGRQLVAQAATWASAHGIARFRAWFAPDNIGIRRLLECLDRPITFGPWSCGTVEIAIDLQAPAPARPKAA